MSQVSIVKKAQAVTVINDKNNFLELNNLRQSTVKTIKSTLPILRKKAIIISSKMYIILFAEHPELQDKFNSNNQSLKLSQAIIAYAGHIDQFEKIKKVLFQISKKHVLSQVQENHYLWVGDALLKAMEEVLGNEFSNEIRMAWKEAYFILARFMINTERTIASKI